MSCSRIEMDMIRKLTITVFAFAVSLGYLAPCYASIVSVSFQNDGMSVASCDTPADIPFDERDREELDSPPMMGQTSVSGNSSMSSGASGNTILIANSSFDLFITHADNVYLRTWMWFPIPPEWELLKVPIAG